MQVSQRLEDGLSLLPDPKCPRNTRVDLSKYPPPATWYLRELKAWDALHKPKKTSATPQQASESSPASLIAADANQQSLLVQDSVPIPIVPKPIPLMSSLVNVYPNMQNPDSNSLFPPANTNILTSHVTDTPPLDPSMPFAQPLPSSTVPFAQPWMSTPQRQAPTAMEFTTTNPFERVSRDNAHANNTTGNESQTENESEQMATEDSIVSVTDVESSSELFRRTMSVSSEVAMEIDWKADSQCELAHCQKLIKFSVCTMKTVCTYV